MGATDEDWISSVTAMAVSGAMDTRRRLEPDVLCARFGRQLAMELAVADVSEAENPLLDFCEGFMETLPRLVGARLRRLLPGLRRIALVPHQALELSRSDEPEGVGIGLPCPALFHDAEGLADVVSHSKTGRLRFGVSPAAALDGLLDYCGCARPAFEKALATLGQYENVACHGTGPVVFVSEPPTGGGEMPARKDGEDDGEPKRPHLRLV